MTNYWPVVGGDAPTALLSVRSPFLQDTTLSGQEAFLIFPVQKICIDLGMEFGGSVDKVTKPPLSHTATVKGDHNCHTAVIAAPNNK